MCDPSVLKINQHQKDKQYIFGEYYSNYILCKIIILFYADLMLG